MKKYFAIIFALIPLVLLAVPPLTQIKSRTFYISQNGGTHVSNTNGIGADSYTAIQTLLDLATNYDGGIEIVADGKFITSRTLKIHSNTKLSGVTKDCGLVLSNTVSQYLLVNDLNGNAYASSNITIQGMTFYGTGWSQNRYLTNGPYYDTNTASGRLWPKSGPTALDGTDYWDPWLLCVWFSGVDGLTVRDVNFDNTRTFALTIGGKVKNATIENVKCYWWPASPATANEDSIHVFGYVDNVRIENIWSNGDDDTIALNLDELSYATNANWAAWRGSNGGCGNIVVRDVWHEGTGGGLVRLLAYNENNGNHWATNITITGIHGQFNSADDFIAGAVNSSFTGADLYVHNLILRDIEVMNGPSTVDLSGVQGKSLTIDNVIGYGAPSYFNFPWGTDRYTPPYIALDHTWENASIRNCHFFTPAGTTNVSMVGSRYAYGWTGIKNLSIANSSISGPGVRAIVANHGKMDTLSFSGITTTNRVWIPGAYTADLVTGGGSIYLSNTIAATNYTEDTTLWLSRCRASGVEPRAHVIRAIDNFNRALVTSGDLAHISEAGFFGGATDITAILPKIRTYYTNQWSTNAYCTNNGFVSADLTPYGLTAGGLKSLGTQIPITTSGIGAQSKTNFSFGLYIQTKAPIVAYDTLYAGASYNATGDNDRFGLESDNTGNGGAPSFWLGNGYGRVAALTVAGMQSVVVSNSVDTRYVYHNGTNASGVASYNSSGFQSGTFLLMKGQNYVGPTNGVVSFWYVGDGAVNQSNLNYCVSNLVVAAASPNTLATYETNYTAADWTPVVGVTKFLGSNNAVYSVSTTKTNLIVSP